MASFTWNLRSFFFFIQILIVTRPAVGTRLPRPPQPTQLRTRSSVQPSDARQRHSHQQPPNRAPRLSTCPVAAADTVRVSAHNPPLVDPAIVRVTCLAPPRPESPSRRRSDEPLPASAA